MATPATEPASRARATHGGAARHAQGLHKASMTTDHTRPARATGTKWWKTDPKKYEYLGLVVTSPQLMSEPGLARKHAMALGLAKCV